MRNEPHYLVVDLFCGAGGTTIGFEQSGVAKVIAAVNHDPKAIESHWKNHPEVKHWEEDIRTLDLTGLVAHVATERMAHPEAKVILWASLECTNFSRAKGGKPRDADSRTLADHLHRYITAIDPTFLMIENVVEFMSWGPLDENGKPLSKRAGCDFMRWCGEVRAHGYKDEWKEMNAADFGARTSRNRLFGCFSKPYERIYWPEPTHAKSPGKSGGMFGQPLKKWEACRPCLDLGDVGTSIFTPGKIKSDKTFERIYAGLIKYVAGMGMKEFMQRYYSGNPMLRNHSLDVPAGVVRTNNTMAIVQPEFLLKYNSTDPKTGEHRNASMDAPAPTIGVQRQPMVVIVQSNGGSPQGKAKSADGPCNTLTAQDNKQVVILQHYYGNGHNCHSTDGPAGTIRTKDGVAMIQAQWLDKQYRGPANHQSIDDPSGTLMSKDKMGLMSAEWIDRPFSQGGKDNDVNGPAGSITNVPKMNLVQSEFLSKQFSGSVEDKNISTDGPSGALTTKDHHAVVGVQFISNPGHGGSDKGVDDPCPTIVARQDKAPLYLIDTQYGNIGQSTEEPCKTITADRHWKYLVQCEGGQVAIPVYETDSEVVVRIKHFMAMYSIVDIKMRMLKVIELKRIQGFPEEYELLGNQADQKKFIGNSVCPVVVKCWALAMAGVEHEAMAA